MNVVLKFLKRFPEVVFLVGTLLFVLLINVSQTKISNVTLHRNGVDEKVALPISVPMDNGEVFNVTFDLSKGLASDFNINIHPDDCIIGLTVNGVAFPYTAYPGYCSWNQGFDLNYQEMKRILGPDVSDFHFVFTVRNGSGLGGMLTNMSSSGVAATIFTVFFWLNLFGLIFFFGSRLKFDKRLILCFFVGLLLRVGYMQDTFYDQRGHDVGGHLHYIQIIADEHRIPASNDCWTCYHPPVYYALAAGTWNFAKLTSFGQAPFVQGFSLLISLFAMGFGLACLKKILTGAPLVAAAILWCVWPSFIMASARIGNDILFYGFYVASLWGIISYLKTNKGSHFLIAVIAATLAYWTKSSGAIAFALLGLVVLIHFVPRVFEKVSKTEWVSFGLFIASCLVVAYFVLFHKIIGNAGGLDDSVLISNAPGNFLYFDVKTFLTNPYIDPWHDELGRQYFWNYLAKTSLFGEFTLLNTDLGKWMASICSLCLLGFAGFGIWGFFRKKMDKVHVVLLVQFILFVVSLMAVRLKYPYSCSNDFRYIIPVLLSALPWTAEGMFGKENSIKIKVVAAALVVAFAVCSSVILISV